MRTPDSSDFCWVDGKRQTVGQARFPVDDPGWQSGFGLFETLAIRRGRLLDLEAHLARLSRGAKQMGLELPDAGTLGSLILQACAEGAPDPGWVKILVTGGGHQVVLRGARDQDEEGRPSTAVLLPWRRNPADPLVGLKTLNYAANRIGAEFARSRGADEGLWLNTRGHLAEGCRSNVFVIQDRKIFTPGPREGILPGVVRGLVLEAARNLELSVHETRVRVPRLRRAREAFLTSSLRGVGPLLAVDGSPVGDGRPGKLTARIAEAVSRLRSESPAVSSAV